MSETQQEPPTAAEFVRAWSEQWWPPLQDMHPDWLLDWHSNDYAPPAATVTPPSPGPS